MKFILFKIKEGKLKQWRDWCTRLSGELHSEALETLKEEQLLLEGFDLFKIGETFYTIGYSDSDGLPSNKEKEINLLHTKNKKECLEYLGQTENLYFLKI